MNENLTAVQQGLNLSKEDLVELVKNGFRASFLQNRNRIPGSASMNMPRKIPECENGLNDYGKSDRVRMK